MGSFLPLDELEPTLSDVLAFIDTFDSDATTSTSSSSDDGKNSPPPSSEDRRKTRKAAASRRCQHKKKAQFLALRAQVTALETKLKELKDPIAKNSVWTLSSRELGQKLDTSQKHKVTQLWKNKAELEKQLRLRSEGRNKELKNVLARQSKVAQAVQEVLSNVTAVVHIEEALRTPLPTMPSVLEGFVPNLNDAIYGELSARLGRLYVDVTTTFESLDHTLVQDLSTGVQVRRDAVTGMPYVELRTAMATQLDLKQTEQAMMDLKACHYNNYGTKKETEFELRDQDMAVELSTLSLSRCHEEENRLLLTFSSLHLGDMMWSNFQRIQANCTESSQQSPASIPAY
uniref:BZIP domain-containing protein n=1 Tax=Phytophthora ramorum TaxID=164328 RepID=H3GPX1_PHYRM